jgi:hypothetical protein
VLKKIPVVKQNNNPNIDVNKWVKKKKTTGTDKHLELVMSFLNKRLYHGISPIFTGKLLYQW